MNVKEETPPTCHSILASCEDIAARLDNTLYNILPTPRTAAESKEPELVALQARLSALEKRLEGVLEQAKLIDQRLGIQI